ncbi:polyprenyl synthetase family protein [Lacticaseibacillus camelliae]|uniref:Farnesyl diphosphate synthase n=1 Tax=Lacticaseibacillus camelliae DSM 22697 = JCM 13995 TaxID=1423730 RepID=A0A0R2F8W9_9LACO|nr:farnesyl diphosphate synthase [Lacticaseibacillus camelliae]KRN24785.1 geranyltranstransferase [Lacticaseibacillus camelliae DSM 22697 = JCM 13995]
MLKETAAWLKPVQQTLDDYLATVNNPHLQAAMAYSVDAGGKRLRPLLLLAVVTTFGGDGEQALPAAAALELLHTYSLIHDDLPAMDNDDLRRGKKTSHKQFDEATAILAGDALQSAAFELLAQTKVAPATLVGLVQTFARAVGPNGMVGGQVMDMDAQGHQIDLQTLLQLQAEKTGALLTAAADMGAQLAHVSASDARGVHVFAAAFGRAFQIQDDINDVTETAAQLGKTPNKDVAEGKATYPSLLGLAATRQVLAEEVVKAQAAASDLSVPAPQLKALLDYFETEKQ